MKRLTHFAVLLVFAILASGSVVSVVATNYTLTVNGNTKQGTVPHFWSRCAGTGGAQLCLNQNWKLHAKIGVAEAGFKAYRGHLILSASNPIRWNGSGTPTYNWTTFDQIYDFLVDTLKTVPIVELSAMPTDLRTASSEWCVPKDFNIWRDLIRETVNHCITRYGREKVRTWIWEVWNEWDYSGFWTNGTEQQYYQLYQKAVEGALAADSLITIGGPATTGSYRLQNFVNFCNTNKVRFDALTNHCYGQQGTGDADPAAIRNDNRTRYGFVKNAGRKVYSLNTEYNTSYGGQGGQTSAFHYSMDSHVNAPFIAKCVKLILDDHTSGTATAPDALSYWAISDIFDEGSWYASRTTTLFGQVFGLINQHGIRKAAFNAHKLLNMMGTTRIELTGGTKDNDGVDGFATVNSTNTEVAVMVYNFYKALAGQTAIDTVKLTVNNLPLANGTVEVRHYRVDSLHSNPYGTWLKLGKPLSTNTSAMEQIRAASNLAEIYPAKTINHAGGVYTETFALPRQGLSLIMFKGDATSVGKKDATLRHNAEFTLQGTELRITRTDSRPIVLALYRLDGKKEKEITVSGSFCDLRAHVNRGIYLVRVKGNRPHFIGKVVVER